MIRTERRPPGLPSGRLNQFVLAGLTLLFLYQLYWAVTLNFFAADVWAGGDYLIDRFGHINVADIAFRFVLLAALLALSDFRRKYRLMMLGVVVAWLGTAVGGGTWRWFGHVYFGGMGMNLHLFSEFPWRWAVIGSSVLACTATLIFILALLNGEHVDALLQDWRSYLFRKLKQMEEA